MPPLPADKPALLHTRLMQQALQLAQQAAAIGEVPVAAIIYDDDGTIVAQAHNRVLTDTDPTAHAEMLAIRQASQKLGTPQLTHLNMVVTLEPCAMCAQAISWARLKNLRFGAYDIKSGGAVSGVAVFKSSACHHKPVVYGGIMEDTCAQLMQQFFCAQTLGYTRPPVSFGSHMPP